MAQDAQSFFEQLDRDYAKAQASPPVDSDAQSVAAPVSTETQPQPEGGLISGLGEAFADTGRALAGGVESAGRGVINTGLGLANAGLSAVGAPEIPNPWGEGGIAPPLVDEPKHFINKMTKSLTEGAIEQIVGNKLANGGQLGLDILKSQAIGTALVADPHRDNLANLVESVPSLQGPISEWLASKPEDGYAMGKFKNILVDTFGAALGSVAFKTIALGFKGGKGQVERIFGKSADEVATELDAEVKGLAAQADSISPESSTNGGHTLTAKESARLKELTAIYQKDSLSQEAKAIGPELEALSKKQMQGNGKPADTHIELNTKLKPPVLEMPGEVSRMEKVNLKNLKTLEVDHNGPMDPEKVLAIRNTMEKEGTDNMPPLVVERRKGGEEWIVDGRHRNAAMISRGGETTTAKVIDSPEYLSEQAAKLKALEEKAGGADKLAKITERMKSADNAFNMTPEQFVDFQGRVKEIMTTEPGDLDNIFVKAGLGDAFNPEKMNSPQAVKETIQALAEVMAPNLEKNVKDYQSFREIKLVSELLKVKPEVMIGNLETWGFNAKQMAPTLVAAKNAIQSLAASIDRDAQSIAIAGVGGMKAKIALMQKIEALAQIEGMAKSIQTAAARTTAAGRIVTKGNMTGQQMQKMIEDMGGAENIDAIVTKIAAAEGNPSKLMPLIRSTNGKWWNAHNEIWINSLLSGVSTHMVNMGTAASQLFMKPFNITLGGAIRGDFETAKEGIAIWKAMGSMIGDSYRMAKMSWKLERPVLSLTDKQLEIVPSVSAQAFDLDPKKWLGIGVDYLGKVARIPSRFLGAEDEFFKQLNYRASLHASATREAMDLVKAGKLDWNKQVEVVAGGKLTKLDEVSAYISKKFDEGFQVEDLIDTAGNVTKGVQTRGLDKKALQYANESTFTQSLKVPTKSGNRSIAESIYQFANEHPAARGTILPFVKVPANLLREGISYTPVLGQLRKQFHADWAEGGTRAAEAWGKLATGSMMLTGATWLAVEGRITGAAPSDKEIRDRMFEKGWQPYSFKIGDTYVPFSRIDPYGIVFGLVGDFAQITHHLSENQRHSYATQLTMAMANLINSKGYLKGLVDFLDILHGGEGDQALDKLNKIAQSYVAGHMPNILRLGQDSSMKEIRSVADALLAKVPGYSGLPAKRGYFGDKVWQPVGWPYSAISPVRPSGETDDPALKELARLADGPSSAQFSLPSKRLGTLNLTDFKNKNGVTAYDRMIELLNETDFHKEINELVTSEDYLQNGTDGDAYYPGSREIDIKKLQKEYHTEAKEKMLDEFPELRQLVEQDEDNAKASKAGDGSDPISRLLDLNK